MGWQDDPIVSPGAPELQPWEKDAVVYPTQKKIASGIPEAIQAGYQSSVPGLIDRGKLPDIVLDPQHSKWYERAAATASQMFHETPESVAGMLAGGAVGSVAGPIGSLLGGGAGAFAVPAAIRESYVQAYSKGEIAGSADFLNRAAIVLKQTGKEALIGAATVGAGAVAARTVGKAIAPAIGTGISVPTAIKTINAASLAAEGGTLVVAPAALEGRMPEPQDFMDAAILLGGLKGVGAVSRKLGTVYAKTGKTPMEVLADAKADPTIVEDLKAERPTAADSVAKAEGKPGEQLSLFPETEIPRAYQGLAREELLRNTIGEQPLKIADVMANPYGTITPGKEPNHVNYRYVDGPEDVKAVQAKIAEVFQAEIEAKRGTESWVQTQEKAAELLRNRTPEELAGKDMSQLAAEAMAQHAMAQRAAFDLAQVASEIRAAGGKASPELAMRQVAAIEMLAMLHAVDQGNGAAIARALNARKAARSVNALGKEAGELLARYGEDPETLARMVGELGTAEGMAKFAEQASRATTWEKVVEAWKAGLVSGPITQVANILGNTTFMATRPLVDAVAVAVGGIRRSPEAMPVVEPLARITGNIHGVLDGSKAAFAVMKTGELTGKTETHRKAIEGTLGEAIRTPFRLLGAADAFFRVTNERGEAYTLATREAVKEGYNPATREFRERVAELAANPTEKMAEQIRDAGVRFTFNAPLGEKSRAIQQTIKKLHLEWAVPFVQTPANVAKEMMRLTPAAPIVKEWRDAIAKGGPEADKAVAEMVIGTAVSTAVFSLALTGGISGQGDPDPKKRATQMASGWQPYSIKIGDSWYSFQRLQPVGTLIGMAADAATVWDHTGEEESDKIPKILATAFANAITNQTFLQGITNLVNAISDPERFGPKFVQNMVGSTVPAIVGQTAQMMDPYQREIYSILDAVQSRIPGAREGLFPKRDVYGEKIEAKDRLGAVSPITVATPSTDKVRTEAARLGVGVSKAPDSIELPAGRDKKLGKIELTPEQRDIFAEKAGKKAHEILSSIVNQPSWDTMPDMAQRQVMNKVFEMTKSVGKYAAVPPEQIQQKAQEIAAELQRRMQPKTQSE
jgi:hypothetical protein